MLKPLAASLSFACLMGQSCVPPAPPPPIVEPDRPAIVEATRLLNNSYLEWACDGLYMTPHDIEVLLNQLEYERLQGTSKHYAALGYTGCNRSFDPAACLRCSGAAIDQVYDFAPTGGDD